MYECDPIRNRCYICDHLQMQSNKGASKCGLIHSVMFSSSQMNKKKHHNKVKHGNDLLHNTTQTSILIKCDYE
jgi:hypothetical protein